MAIRPVFDPTQTTLQEQKVNLNAILTAALNDHTEQTTTQRSASPTQNSSHAKGKETSEEPLMKSMLAQMLTGCVEKYKSDPDFFREQMKVQIFFSEQKLLEEKMPEEITFQLLSIKPSESRMLKVFINKITSKDHLEIFAVNMNAFFEHNEELFSSQQKMVQKLISEGKAYTSEVPKMTTTSLTEDEIADRLLMLTKLDVDPDTCQSMALHMEFDLEALMALFHVLSKNEDIIPFLVPEMLNKDSSTQIGFEEFFTQLEDNLPTDKFATLKKCYVSYLLEHLKS